MDLTRPGSIYCFGEVLLRLNPVLGTPLSASHLLSTHVGGAEANVAAALAQLGRATELVTLLPADALGDLAMTELRRAGVGTRHVLRKPGRLGLYFLDLGSGVRPSRIIYDRANSVFAGDPLAIDWMDLAPRAAWFHVSGITLAVSEASALAARKAVGSMREHGVPISFDVNYRSSLWHGREAEVGQMIRSMAEMADVLFGSAYDIGQALGQEVSGDMTDARREAAVTAFAAFPSLSVIASTIREISPAGSHRLSARVDSRESGVEAAPATLNAIIDRIGSGDAFAGAVIDSLLRGETIARCARLGLAAAALKHAVSGDRWIGSRDELEQFDPARGSDVRR
jgi:2-dehydro-3-deoxygluconokinase